MGTAQVHFNVKQDEDFHVELTVKDAAGVVIDITGWTWEGEIHEQNGGNIAATMAFNAIDLVNGRIDMDIARAVTLPLDAKAYNYDVFSIDLTPLRKCRFSGTFTVLERFTGTT